MKGFSKKMTIVLIDHRGTVSFQPCLDHARISRYNLQKTLDMLN